MRIKTLLILFLFLLISVSSQVLADNYTASDNFTTTGNVTYVVPADGMYDITSIVNFGIWLNITGGSYDFDYNLVFDTPTVLTMCDGESSDCEVGYICNASNVCEFGVGATMLNSTILPTNPANVQNLEGYCNGTDNTGNNLTYFYTWYRNNTIYDTGSYINVTSDVNTLVDTILANETNTDEDWYLECILNNENENSTALNSSTVTILDSTPIILSSTIEPTTAYTNNDLYLYCQGSTNIYDNLTYFYTAYKDGTEYKTGNFSQAIYECVQMQANVSGDCGADGTGIYSMTGTWTNPENVIDGNINSVGYSSTGATIYVNYTKPSNVISADWTVVELNDGLPNDYITQTRYDVPEGCFNESVLQFSIYSEYGIVGGSISWSCYDGSVWNTIQSDSNKFPPRPTEEFVTWELPFNNENQTVLVDTIYSNETTANEDWILECSLDNGYETSTLLNGSTLTINNFVANVTSSRIEPASPDQFNNLTGYCSGYDADGDNITYYYELWKNGLSIDSGIGLNEIQTCYQPQTNESTACGGLDNGSYEDVTWNMYLVSDDDLIDNNVTTWVRHPGFLGVDFSQYMIYKKPAGMIGATWEVVQEDGTYNLTIPIECYSQDELTVRVLQPATPSTLWQCFNGNDWQTLKTTSGYKQLYEESMYWTLSEVIVTEVNYTDTSVGDEFILSCIANDGFNNSTAVNSSTTTILNNIPVTEKSVLLPAFPDTNTELLGYCNVSDLELNNINIEYLFYIDGVANETGIVNNLTQNVLHNVANLSNVNTDKNDNVIFSCRGNDGTDNSTWLNSSTITIGNTAPVIQTARIEPTYPIISDDLIGYAMATDSDTTDSLTYEYQWYRNGGLYSSGTSSSETQGIELNIANISSSLTAKNDGWLLRVRGYDGTNYSDWLYSSYVYIDTITIEQAYITPAYANVNEQLNCNFNVTERNSNNLNTTITWYNSTTNINTYDYTFVNTTQDIFITTGLGTGSVPANIINDYETWSCVVESTTGFISTNLTTNITIYPFDNITLYSPANNTQSTNPNFNVSYEVESLDGGIICTLNIDNTNVMDFNVSSGVVSSLNYTLSTEGVYPWYLSCIANGHTEGLNLTGYNYIYDTNAPTYNNYNNNQTNTTPQDGDVIGLSVNVSDTYNIDICKLETNNNGTWVNSTTYNINTPYNYLLNMEFTVPTDSNGVSYWRVWCNNSAGLSSTSLTQNYSVKNFVPPTITLNTGNRFKADNLTIVTSQTDNLDLDITFNDKELENASIEINCTTNGSIYSWSQTGIVSDEYNHTATVSLTDTVPQTCEVTISSFDTNIVPNGITETYTFYIGSYLSLSSLNLATNTTDISGYTITVTAGTATPDNDGTKLISSTTGFYNNLTVGTHTINITHPDFVAMDYIVTIENQTQNLVYETAESVLKVIPTNTKTGLPLVNQTTTVIDDVSGATVIQSPGNISTATFYLNASNYSVLITVPGYDNARANVSLTNQEVLTITPSMTFIAGFLFVDERTGEPFNVSNADRVEFLMKCPDDTNVVVLITNDTEDISIPCNFSSFRVLVEYGTESYYRNYLFTPDDIFNITIYLIDLTTTDAIYTEFFLDDLLDEYDRPALHIKRIIGGETATITADYSDAENKVGTYLIKNFEYILEVTSDNQPLQELDNYISAAGGSKNLKLYTISSEFEPTGFSNSVLTDQGIIEDNTTNTSTLYARFQDLENNTDSLTWKIYADGYKDADGNYVGILIYNTTVLNPYQVDMYFNQTGYENRSLYNELEIVNPEAEGGIKVVAKAFHVATEITLDIFGHLRANTAQWFFVLLLSVLAIMSTIRSSNIINILMIAFGFFFAIVGWFGVSKVVLVLAALIGFLALIKKGDKNMN